jgi:glycosyltransferase involved in cell wall biosynthesis
VKIVHQVLSGEVAGGQLVALELAAAARAAGHEAVVVSPTPGPFLDRAAAAGVPSRVVPLGRSFRADAAMRYARFLRSERAHVVHTHGHLAGNVLGRVAGRLAGAAVVAHMHVENAFRADRLRVLQVGLDDATARLCARILVVSEATRAALERQGYPRALMEVVHNGVALERAEPRRVDGVPADAPLVVHVGRLAPVKGQRELIEALAEVPELYAVLVGVDQEEGGAYRRELEREASRQDVADRVVFAGYRDDVPALIAGADALVLPSWVEGLPLVVLEAMAQARPVVATRIGGTDELVADGETGLLVPPRDAGALAAALRSLLADRTRARSLGEAGRRRAEQRFSRDAMTSRVLAVYAEIVPKMA